jgi:hypothetical protein
LAIFFLEFLHLRNRENSKKKKIPISFFVAILRKLAQKNTLPQIEKEKENSSFLPTNDQPATAGLLEVREPADTVTGPFCPTAVDKMAKSAREKRPRARRARGLRTCLSGEDPCLDHSGTTLPSSLSSSLPFVSLPRL